MDEEIKFIASFPPDHRYFANITSGGDAKLVFITSADQIDKIAKLTKFAGQAFEVTIKPMGKKDPTPVPA